jgi:hypothetical protein
MAKSRSSSGIVLVAGLILIIGANANNKAQQPVDYDQAYVMGMVVNPMAVSLKDTVTLAQAIAKAGGPIKNKKSEKVSIIRLFDKGNMIACVSLKEIKREEIANFQLQANDILEVTPGKCARSMDWSWSSKPDLPFRIIK